MSKKIFSTVAFWSLFTITFLAQASDLKTNPYLIKNVDTPLMDSLLQDLSTTINDFVKNFQAKVLRNNATNTIICKVYIPYDTQYIHVFEEALANLQQHVYVLEISTKNVPDLFDPLKIKPNCYEVTITLWHRAYVALKNLW